MRNKKKLMIWAVTMEIRFPVIPMMKVINSYNLLITQRDIHKKHYHVSSKGTCRYCGAYNKNDRSVKDSIESGLLVSPKLSSFSKLAHAVPTLIGNKTLISKDECNQCNELFGVLENDLAGFLGASRTTSKIAGRKGIPKTKFNKTEFIDFVDSDLIIASTENSQFYSETEKYLIIEESKKFNPQNIYKCFVKMAISILPKEKLVDFGKTIEWLNGQYKPTIEDKPQFSFTEIKWPVRNIYPFITVDIYERKTYLIDIPYMFARVSFRNYAFQFNIPFSKMNNLVTNFYITPIIKNEHPYPDLLDDNKLWQEIVGNTTIRKLDLFLDDTIVITEKQYFTKGDSYDEIDKESLPQSIKDYLDIKGIKY